MYSSFRARKTQTYQFNLRTSLKYNSSENIINFQLKCDCSIRISQRKITARSVFSLCKSIHLGEYYNYVTIHVFSTNLIQEDVYEGKSRLYVNNIYYQGFVHYTQVCSITILLRKALNHFSQLHFIFVSV